jgi:CheY-like chemotaxis protein
MGHEDNNPLTYVLYNVETLAEELGTLAQRLIPPDTVTAQTAEGLRWLRSLAEIPVELREMSEFAEFAAEGARRICELVKSLRTFSRLDEAQNESLSLNDALETALSMTAKELSVRARVVRKLGLLPNVSAKQGELCQVFINLLVNASQAIEEGHVDANEIFVRTWSDDGEVFAAISDTGVGISADKLDKVFEPFFTTKPIGSGTGLGLSICTKLASSFGGRLSVKSKPRVGTTFTLSLPAVAPLAARAGPVDLDEEPLAVCASLRGRILVIDDEPIVRKVLDELLRAHDTVLAATGTEARGILLEDTAFDVILCDLMMPDLSGMELFAWLKVRDPLAAQRVVFITGGAFTPKTQAFLAAVNQPVIDKPFNPRSLRATVATLVHTARQGSSMESPA